MLRTGIFLLFTITRNCSFYCCLVLWCNSLEQYCITYRFSQLVWLEAQCNLFVLELDAGLTVYVLSRCCVIQGGVLYTKAVHCQWYYSINSFCCWWHGEGHMVSDVTVSTKKFGIDFQPKFMQHVPSLDFKRRRD